MIFSMLVRGINTVQRQKNEGHTTKTSSTSIRWDDNLNFTFFCLHFWCLSRKETILFFIFSDSMISPQFSQEISTLLYIPFFGDFTPFRVFVTKNNVKNDQRCVCLPSCPFLASSTSSSLSGPQHVNIKLKVQLKGQRRHRQKRRELFVSALSLANCMHISMLYVKFHWRLHTFDAGTASSLQHNCDVETRRHKHSNQVWFPQHIFCSSFTFFSAHASLVSFVIES